MSDFTPINQLDFFEMKESFKTYLQAQDRFADFNFEGSNLNVLLDVLAYNTFYNQYYNNVVISEMFLDSAQHKNSVVSHAKELNYLPSSRRSSYATINLTILADQESNFFSIPRYTKFNARCGDKTYSFITDQEYIAERTSGNTFVMNGVVVYEGRMVEEAVSIDNPILSNSTIDTTSLRITVNGVEYIQKGDIFGVTSTDKVFYLQPEEDGRYSVQFGKNTFGVEPISTDVILANYRITNGAEANGVTSVSISNRTLNQALSIATVIAVFSDGGRDEETLDSIKMFAPKAQQIQERAVTKKDYDILLRRRFPNINSVSVFGGDELDPPQYGRVVIAVDVANGEGATESELSSFREFLKDKTPLTIEPVFVPTKFLNVGLEVKVKYDVLKTPKQANQIRTLVYDAIIAYADKNINGFNARYPSSQVSNLVDAIDVAIVSTEIDSTAIIEYTPPIGLRESPTFEFNNVLYQPYPYNEANGLSTYQSSLTSTVFTIDGAQVYLQDDGNGIIFAVKSNVATTSIHKRNIGTINYTTGKVSLSSLIVEGYEGTKIRLSVKTANDDIISKRDRILQIKQEDINVVVDPV